MYRSNFVNRYNQGKQSENKILPIIKDYFKRDIKPTEDRYNTFDFIDNEYKYELKTRTNRMEQYPTTMITCNKCDTNSILLFKYTDKLAYIEYNPDKFKEYDTKLYTRYEDKDPVEHIYIPIKDLTIIC